MLIGVPVMSKLIRMKDTFIVMIGAIAHAAGRIVFILANRPELFYVGKYKRSFSTISISIKLFLTINIISTMSLSFKLFNKNIIFASYIFIAYILLYLNNKVIRSYFIIIILQVLLSLH